MKKIKLITFYSESHQILYNYFLESFNKFLSEDYYLLVKKINQLSQTGHYGSRGFDLTMVEKINWIIENIDEYSDEVMVFSDCDVQFFDKLIFNIEDFDILFQNDYSNFDFSWFPDGKKGIGNTSVCAGFFICKQNTIVKNFFIEVRNVLINNINGFLHDQFVINKLLNENYKIQYGFLNNNLYWTVAFATNGKVWSGEHFEIPNTIIVHHANWTVGLDNKINLLKLVKNKWLMEQKIKNI
jgi:hypothetical protein